MLKRVIKNNSEIPFSIVEKIQGTLSVKCHISEYNTQKYVPQLAELL